MFPQDREKGKILCCLLHVLSRRRMVLPFATTHGKIGGDGGRNSSNPGAALDGEHAAHEWGSDD
jgi:hypothetical protein